MRNVLTALVAGLLASLSLAGTNPPVWWETLSLPGKTLVLMDRQKVERYRLLDSGAVAASLGSIDGPVAAPLMFWRVEKDTLVVADSPEAPPRDTFRLVRVDGKVLHVTRQSGAAARFRLTASPP